MNDQQNEALDHFRKGLELTGYQLVHTWRDGYGNHTDWIYERECRLPGKVDAICLTFAHGRISLRSERANGSYLLAKEILSNREKYIEINEDHSVCGTSGVSWYYNQRQGCYYSIFYAAGHGAQAKMVGYGEESEEMRAAWAATEQVMIENAEKRVWSASP